MHSLKQPSSHSYLNSGQHCLLGGWDDIRDDVRRINRQLARQVTSNGCAAGDGFCRDRAGCSACDAQVRQVQAAADTLFVDTWRFWPVLQELFDRSHDATAGQKGHAIARELYDLVAECERAIHRRLSGICIHQALASLPDWVSLVQADVERFDRLL